MVQQVVAVRVDDIDETEGAETVVFALDGTEYEIDLKGAHAEELRAALAPYIENARRATGKNGKKKPRRRREDLPDIRQYARSRGYPIQKRGRVPERIIAEYDIVRARTAG